MKILITHKDEGFRRDARKYLEEIRDHTVHVVQDLTQGDITNVEPSLLKSFDVILLDDDLPTAVYIKRYTTPEQKIVAFVENPEIQKQFSNVGIPIIQSVKKFFKTMHDLKL